MDNKVKFAVDLLWVRYGEIGGGVALILNILDGFMALDGDYEMWLLVAKDNQNVFDKYVNDHRVKVKVCDVYSKKTAGRIIWQNTKLKKVLRDLDISVCFEPNVYKPINGGKNIRYVTTITDLQVLHYPQYFSFVKQCFMKFNIWQTVRTSKHIVAISQYVNEDIQKHYKVSEDKVSTIYVPVVIDERDLVDFVELSSRYGVTKKGYYFTVSSLLPHKNLSVLIDAFKLLKEKYGRSEKLIISGVGGGSKQQLLEKVESNGLQDNIILTSFISDAERNGLYKNCKVFVFPSVFEGFGMPTVEAMLLGVPVLTTKLTSIPEVTQNKAKYVENPYSAEEWADAIIAQVKEVCGFNFEQYDCVNIAKQYMDIICEMCNN